MLTTDRKWALSCYIPVFNSIFVLLTFVRMVNSDFCLFHARQGVVLFVFWFFTLLVSFFNQNLGLMLLGVVLFFHGIGFYFSLKGKIVNILFVHFFAQKIPKYFFFRILTGRFPENNNDLH